MTTRHYDAVVVGGRISAAILAALLGKRGLRGVIIDQGELASMDGRQLPDLVLNESGSLAMELVHGELGLREELRVKARPIATTFQAIFPDERVDIFSDRTALLAELRRAFGAHAEPLASAFTKLEALDAEVGAYLGHAGEIPASGFFGRRAAQAEARRHLDLTKTLEASGFVEGLVEELAEILLAPLPFVTHIDGRRPSDITVGRYARAIHRLFRGLSRLEDGRTLRSLFLGVAEKKGFEVRRSAVESIEPGKKLQVRVAGARDDLITSDVLIDCSADLSGLDTIPHKLQSKELALLLQSAKPKGFLHGLSIEVDADVIPPGMAEHLILLNGRRDPSRFNSNDPDAEDRPIFLIRRPAAERSGRAAKRGAPTPPAGARVELVAVHPVSTVRAHAQRMEQLDEVIRARVERLVPFLHAGHPVIATLSMGGTGDLRPFLSHPLFGGDLDPLAGLAGVSMRTSWKNVFIAGPAVIPGLGVEGEYLSALQAADAAESLLRGQKHPKTLAARTPSNVGARPT